MKQHQRSSSDQPPPLPAVEARETPKETEAASWRYVDNVCVWRPPTGLTGVRVGNVKYGDVGQAMRAAFLAGARFSSTGPDGDTLRALQGVRDEMRAAMSPDVTLQKVTFNNLVLWLEAIEAALSSRSSGQGE